MDTVSDFSLVAVLSEDSEDSSLSLSLISDWTLRLSLSYITTDGQSASLSWYQAPIWGLWPNVYYCQTIEGFWYGAPSLTRGQVCLLQCTMFNIQYILLSQSWDSPNLEDQVPVFISPRKRVARLYPQALDISSQISAEYEFTIADAIVNTFRKGYNSVVVTQRSHCLFVRCREQYEPPISRLSGDTSQYVCICICMLYTTYIHIWVKVKLSLCLTN
jgi:hypothetical protein